MPSSHARSYCTEGNGTAGSTGGPGGDAYTCGPWRDSTTAKANHQAHIAFFNEAFPEFEQGQNRVTLVGESYAGVYVPLFVNEWLDDPIRGPNGARAAAPLRGATSDGSAGLRWCGE